MMKQKLLSMLALLLVAATSTMAQLYAPPSESGMTVTLSPSPLTMNVGKTETVTCDIKGGTGSPRWSISGDNGIISFVGSTFNTTTVKVTANAAGTASIKCEVGSASATCTVTVSPQTYNVTVKEGTDDATNWAISPNPATEGQTVTIKYTGTKHVKSIKAVKKAAAATAYTLAESTVGMIVGSDGKAYAVADKDKLPSGVTAAGMVAYKNGSNGLVIALADEANKMDWSTANGATGAAAHTPVISGYSWKLPSQAEWNQMFDANGGNDGSYTGLNTALATAGGDSSKLQEGFGNDYWSSTPGYYDEDCACGVLLLGGDAMWGTNNSGTNLCCIRACLAF